ncbi:MFS transporter [Christensenellaceae bacterium OttesenSCG-928-L17]|nr:MFS transporter [Christensenellaceae bacterium OttesenSCG-928-L17]
MNKKRILQLFIGAAMLLFLGLIYGWSVFVAPLEAEFGWQRAETSLVFTFSMVFFCLGGFASGLLQKKFHYRTVLRVCAAFLLAGFLLSSRINSLTGIYFSYGVLCGTGVGLGYNCILNTAAKWYPEKPGFSSGMLLLGFGTGALLLSTGATALISLLGWRTTFLIFSILFACVILLGAQLLRVPSAEETEALRALTAPAQAANIADTPQIAPKDALRLPSFWILFFWAALLSLIGLAVIGQSIPIAMETGLLVAAATTVSGMISVCNGLSRLITGGIFDKIGPQKTMYLIVLEYVIATPLLYFALRTGNAVLLVIGFVFLGLGYGGTPTLMSATVNRRYGNQHYAINYGIINFNLAVSALIGPSIASSIQQTTGSYANAFPVLFAICIPAFLLLLVLKKVR